MPNERSSTPAGRQSATATTARPKFGLMDQGWAAADTSDADAIRVTLDTLKLADDLGFDSVWIGEHHNVRSGSPFYGRIPASEIFCAYAAAQTRRITVGTGVRILSTTPAQRTAEEMSLLCLLTGGRAEFGIGLGSGQYDTKSKEEKGAEFRSLLGQLLGILRNDETVAALPLSPVPPADIASRIWAAGRDETTLAFLAENDVNLVVGQAEIGQGQAGHIRRYRASGGKAKVRGVRLVFVAPTHDEAIEGSRAAADLYFQLMANNGYRKEAIAKGYLTAEIMSREDMMLHINFVVGTPDEVAAQLNDYIALTGIDQLDAMVQIPLLAPADVHRSVRLLKAEVLPKLVYDRVDRAVLTATNAAA